MNIIIQKPQKSGSYLLTPILLGGTTHSGIGVVLDTVTGDHDINPSKSKDNDTILSTNTQYIIVGLN